MAKFGLTLKKPQAKQLELSDFIMILTALTDCAVHDEGKLKPFV